MEKWKTLAIDPGRTSGIAAATGPTDYAVLQANEFHAIEVIERLGPEVIIMEKFVVQKRPNIDAFPLELIGCIHDYCRKNVCSLVEQMPSNIKGVSDVLLKKCGLWVPGYPHGRDALKHLCYYYMVKAPMDDRYAFGRLIAGDEVATIVIGGYPQWLRDEKSVESLAES